MSAPFEGAHHIKICGPNELRWRHKRSSYVLPGTPLFDTTRHWVDVLDEATARAFVTTHHYSSSMPAVIASWGLWRSTNDDAVLCGVAVLSVPMSQKVLTNVFGTLEPYQESAELGRFVLLDMVEHNAETWFLTRVLHDAQLRGFRGIVSFSDPQPRTRADGSVAFAGHHGGIYIAANAAYLGRGTPRSVLVDRDGVTMNERALSKLRTNDTGHLYVEQRLLAVGASVKRAGESNSEWLLRVRAEGTLRQVRHRGVHRFAFVLGTKTQRRRLRDQFVQLPRPTHVDPAV